MFFFPCSCLGQNNQIEKFNSRELLEKFSGGKLLEPCQYPEKVKILLKNKPVGTKTPYFILDESKTNSKLKVRFSVYFEVGENDCLIHYLKIFTNKKEILDSLVVDYLGDSFGRINIESEIEVLNDNISIVQKESEILYDYDKKLELIRKKNLVFILNKYGKIELENKSITPISKSGKLFFTNEYFLDYYQNLKILSQNDYELNSEKYAIIISKNKVTGEKSYFLLNSFNSPFYTNLFLLGNTYKTENLIKSIEIKSLNSNQEILEITLENSMTLGLILEKNNKGNITFNKYYLNREYKIIHNLSKSKSLKNTIMFLRTFN